MSEPNDPSRDVRQIDSSDVASRAFPESLTRPAPTTIDKGFAVVIKQSVLNDIHKHGQSVERIEVCGVLVGNLYRDPTGPYLSIDACIRGDHASSASTNVTFTADTWTHIQESLELDHPGKRIVGWYHTHPSFGIFLSEMDVFICDNFFPLPWQVAYVFDPVQLQDGCFAWHEGKPERWPMMVEKDVAPAVAVTSGADKNGAPMQAQRTLDVELLMERIETLEKRQMLLTAAVLGVAVLAIVLPLLMYALSGHGTPAVDRPSDLPHVPTTPP